MVNLLQSAASFFLITVILLLWFPQYHQFAIASYPILLFGHKCIASGHYTPNSYFHYNFEKVFTNLTSAAALTGFYNTTITTSTHPAHGLFLCRGDVSHQDCYDCVHNAILTLLEECPFQTSASIWYNLCMLRYSDESFFGKLDDLPGTFLPNLGNFTSNVTKAMQIIKETVIELAMEVANNSKKFGTNEVNLHSYRTTVHVLEQCTLDLSENDCFHCLQEAINQIPNCCYGRQGARLLLPSCNVRYELYPFYNKSAIALETPGSAAISPTVNASHTGKGKQQPNRRKRWPHIYAIVTVPAVIGVLLIFGIQICKRRRKAKEIFSVNIDEIEAAESLRFELSSIKAATCNFSAENQLGEGGFGKVYKGKLENGQEVAVKRLSKNSRQGILEFITEVVLVAKLQHKNLVKLFGFCLASREKILVYELLPNASLDRFLFDPVKRVTLDWKTRFKIINGIARGLLYLHEDSRLKIIHRDLKPSNILLDEVMNPKISDFGLARLSGVDQTQGNTKRIAGTYGYMAPEYALAGHFSVKSDVYSFGVMILEIVSSQRNRIFDRAKDEEELLHRAWRLWNEGVVSQLADEALSNKYSSEEITKCIHIGLLCIQEDATKRPGMATIVAALNGQPIPLPLPTPPRLFTTTAEDNSEALEHENEIQGSNFQVRTLTGTENITDLYPR